MRILQVPTALAVALLLCACPTTDDSGSDGGGGGSDGGAGDGGGDGGAPFSWPDSPENYTGFLPAYVHQITSPERVSSVYTCCRDFGDISKDKIEENRDDIDNAISAMFDALAPLTGVNFQSELDANVQNGSLMILWDHGDYHRNTDPFVLVRLDGEFAGGTTWTEASAGNGQFLVSRDSFLPGSGEPATQLAGATIDDSARMNASGDSLWFTMSMLGAPISLLVRDLQVAATADETIDSISYVDGELSGYVTVEEFFGALDDYVAENCSCLGISGPIFQQDPVTLEWSSSCVDGADTLCTQPSESFCVTMAQSGTLEACNLLPSILPEAADLDLDPLADGYEGMSVGLEWEAMPAEITGVAP